MRPGSMHRFGEVILAEIQFADSPEIKTRPAVILFEEYGNIVVAGITSNIKMDGIFLSKKEGAIKDSIIKLNYIFTISDAMIKKVLFSLSDEKKREIINGIMKRLKL
jgi:mRNA interferase MazF